MCGNPDWEDEVCPSPFLPLMLTQRKMGELQPPVLVKLGLLPSQIGTLYPPSFGLGGWRRRRGELGRHKS